MPCQSAGILALRLEECLSIVYPLLLNVQDLFKKIVAALWGVLIVCPLDSIGGVYLLYPGPKAGVKVVTSR